MVMQKLLWLAFFHQFWQDDVHCNKSKRGRQQGCSRKKAAKIEIRELLTIGLSLCGNQRPVGSVGAIKQEAEHSVEKEVTRCTTEQCRPLRRDVR